MISGSKNSVDIQQTTAPLQKLHPDIDQLRQYIECIFKHALPGNIVSLRAFPQTESRKALFIRSFEVEEGLNDIIMGAFHNAREAAKLDAVFPPPVATFQTIKNAKVSNLAEGLVISVECDARPQAALRTLTDILGEPTLVVKSGGVWRNPETGGLEDKLHLYWRLMVPARDVEGFSKLKEALKLATGLVGADASNTAIVHPLRWPGSWHLKGKPRLCHIVVENDCEIGLDEALELLRAAAPVELQQSAAHEARIRDRRPRSSRAIVDQWSLESPVDIDKLKSAMQSIPNDDAVEWFYWKSVMCLRVYAATKGSEEGYLIFDAWSRRAKGKYNEAKTRFAWEEAASSPPDHTGIDAIYALAREHGWQAKPTIIKPVPKVAVSKRKALPPHSEAVKRIEAEIQFFIDEVVIGKKRCRYIDFGNEVKVGEFDLPRSWAVIAPPGTYKSSISRKLIAERIKLGLLHKVVVLVPRLEFAAEYLKEFEEELGIGPLHLFEFGEREARRSQLDGLCRADSQADQGKVRSVGAAVRLLHHSRLLTINATHEIISL